MSDTSPPEHPSYRWRRYQFPERGAAPAEPDRFAALMNVLAFPRASQYDPVWVWLNMMGPPSPWLVEALAETLDLRPGMRVLDMGCGAALSSIFLARDYGLEVWAADLWISPTDNWARITEAGLGDRVYPLRVEASQLPFAEGFFDALLSVDAYHYFGLAEDYLAAYAPLVRPGGAIAILVPGDEGDEPAHETFRSLAWWRQHWAGSGLVDILSADRLPDGRELWLRFCAAGVAWDGQGSVRDQPDGPMLLAPSGQSLGFVRLVAARK